jgi:thiol-disulfide isomerase/thioredoxin
MHLGDSRAFRLSGRIHKNLREQKEKMGLKRTLAFGLFPMVLAGLIAAGYGWAEERNPLFPSYGSGPVEVRLYTDYFCPPCRAMEPGIEPILKDLHKQNAIRLILVDAPLSHLSLLFAKNFLYALRENNDLENAFRVRNSLLGAATRENIKTQEQIETLFKEKGIPFSSFDAKPAFDHYNALLKEDKINGTPTCVVIKSGQKKVFVGGPDIINALKTLP